MSKGKSQNTGRKAVPHQRHTPTRVASRLKGVVKNLGIKPKKKEGKGGE